MLRRLRARAIDGATMLARYLDARRERDDLRAELRCWRSKAERYHSISDGLHAEWDAAMGERDELQAEVERLTAENDELRAAGDRLVAETVSFAAERGELLRLRAEIERLTAERDEHAQAVSVLACRIDRVQQERDARIPTDIDGAQAWAERHGVSVVPAGSGSSAWWSVMRHGAPCATSDTRADAVVSAVEHALLHMWRQA